MVRWVEWCRAHSTNLIRDKERGSDYGDWLAINAKTPKDLIGTAYFAYSTHLLAKTAAVLGRTEDAAKYQALFEQIKAAFNERFVQPDGHITGNTQTGYVLALKFELLPEELRAKAARYLVDDIRSKDWHLSTGFLGVGYLLPMLTQTGNLDAAYRLLMQDTFPSWLFSVKNGATTIWERWDGWTPEKGFQDPGMNSFNHYSLGSCGEWLFDTVAGIGLNPEQPGFRHIIIRPRIGGGLTWVKARYQSIRGPIVSEWSVHDDGTLTLDVEIPANTTATVYVPAEPEARVTEGDGSVEKAEGVQSMRVENDARVFEVGSGKYQFRTAVRRGS
jgi:alpha-L-rhamnosidase